MQADYPGSDRLMRCEPFGQDIRTSHGTGLIWYQSGVTIPLLLLTGPTGAGKSTTARAWAAQGVGPRALLDVDAVRAHIRAGFAAPEDGWTTETERQWALACEVTIGAARTYLASGVGCVIDVYAPPYDADPWALLLAELGGHRIILLPRRDICLQRNRNRGRQPALSDELAMKNYDDLAHCVQRADARNVIDNSDLSPDETLREVTRLSDSASAA